MNTPQPPTIKSVQQQSILNKNTFSGNKLKKLGECKYIRQIFSGFDGFILYVMIYPTFIL